MRIVQRDNDIVGKQTARDPRGDVVREIVVVSGKGGTGKTSIVAAFAKLAKERVVLGDCDVDASNLALLLPGQDMVKEPFFAGLKARIEKDKCSLCGDCVDVCRYDALIVGYDVVPEVDDRFQGIDWRIARTGAPILPGALGWLDCYVVQAIISGDHTIFVGEVADGDMCDSAEPLLYHNRQWCCLGQGF